ncbi:MAG: alkaline phosphatase family protein [Pyrinomonadaceae bacterium]
MSTLLASLTTPARRARYAATFILAFLLVFVSPGVVVVDAQGPARRPQARSVATPAQTSPSQITTSSAPRARLVLLIAVDQFRYDFLERFGDLFVEGGLHRLERDGASWTRADFDNIPTETAPGHATMLTGTWPAENGIIGNEWFDRDSGKRVTSVSDETVKLFGGGNDERASSPRRLLASTLGDELRFMTAGRSKVVGISVKDRGAILPAGRAASAAYWYSSQTGRMVSSSYYFNQLPEWVEKFNRARPADKFFGARWERLLSEAEYTRRAGEDAPAWESVGGNKTITFPHVVTGGATAPNKDFYDALNYSPFSNDLLLDFAKQAITNEALGADADTDVLSVSFSANDIVGHRFGPYSHEAMDMTLRVDRQIAALLDFVDARVGLRNTLVAFTADHGVAPVPEHAVALNLPGGRVKSSEVVAAMRSAIKARYGREGAADATADYIQTYRDGDRTRDAFTNASIYFNPVALARDGISREEIERVAGEAAMTVPGIVRYYTRTQLQRGAVSPHDPLARRALHGFNAQRSGDIVVISGAFKYLPDSMITATHGSPYSYDTHVPLIMMGTGLAPGRYIQPAAPSDIAPTLAALLRSAVPSNSTGRILSEAMR